MKLNMLNRQDSFQRHLLSCTWALNICVNLALLAVATGLLYVTIVAYLGKSEDLLLIYHYAPINVIVITICAVVLAWATILGIVSLVQLSSNGLLTAVIILFLLLVGSIDYTIWRAFKEDYSERGEVFRQLKVEIHQYHHREKIIIDILQTKLSCCGAKDPKDWMNVIPPSCCSPSPSDSCDATNPLFHNKGCFDALRTFMTHYNWMILIGLGFLSSLEIIVICLSYIAFRAIRNNKPRKNKVQDVEVAAKIPRIPSTDYGVKAELPQEEKAQTEKPVEQEEPKIPKIPSTDYPVKAESPQEEEAQAQKLVEQEEPKNEELRLKENLI